MKIPSRFWNIIPLRFKSKIQARFQPDNALTFPENAYFLTPDVNGNFTKAMVDNAVALGEEYIVFDADTLDVHYEESIHELYGGLLMAYLYLTNIKKTALNPLILDFRKVNIDCFPDPNNVLLKHDFINLESCENIILKFGTVDGDRYKRSYATQSEIKFEDTMLVRSGKGCKDIIVDGGNAAGFMADMLASIVYGSKTIAFEETEKNYYIQPDGRFESIFYNVNPNTYDRFGLTGGVGFNRLLKYDMEDVTFKFFNINNTLLAQLDNCQYFESYNFPDVSGIVKMKVNVNPLNGMQESPNIMYHRLEYNPNNGTIVRNMSIGDNHRGGIANIGAHAIIENNNFFTTERYYTVPAFPDTTRYHVNCEDAVSRNLIIRNNTFNTRFNMLLLTHNLNADITNNIFIGEGNASIFIYQLLYGSITNNDFQSTGTVNAGTGTNKGNIIVSGNTGTPKVALTNAAEWRNNTFSNNIINGRGKCNNNTFTNYNVDRLNWTKDIHDNEFIGLTGYSITLPKVYVYRNNFKDFTFRLQDGNNKEEQIVFDTVEIDNTTSPALDGFYRNYGDAQIIAVNSTFKKFKINNTRTNEAIDFEDGNWYFENCLFTDIQDYLIILGSNIANNIPEKFYFKNCTFQGSGLIASNTVWGTGMNYEIIFDNCTIDSLLTMPSSYSFGTVTMPTLIEPRTQPIPILERDDVNVRTIVRVDFHLFALKIRNKNTLVIDLDKDVIAAYIHYTATPNDFEYSIDGGLYWDSL